MGDVVVREPGVVSVRDFVILIWVRSLFLAPTIRLQQTD